MRLGILALSTVLLSGCSWFGGGYSGGYNGFTPNYGDSGSYGGNYGAMQGAAAGPCQIYAPSQPVPHGCDPSSVTLATQGGYGGFPQSPDFSDGQYISGGYGSHVAEAGQHSKHKKPKQRLSKPTMRGTLSLGMEKSISGDYLDHKLFPIADPSLSYNPDTYAEGSTSGSPASGQTVSTVYSAVREDTLRPDLSFEDVHSTPLSLKGGLEFIASPRTTLFANVGYAYSKGENKTGVVVNGQLRQTTVTQDYDDTGAAVGTAVTNVSFIPNQQIARYNYDFTNMERLGLEAGGRHYFEPILSSTAKSTITPFVAASAGVNHYNAQSFDVTQEQVFYERAFTSAGATSDFYTVNPATTTTINVFDSQWVPKGALTTGMEWQMSPKTALAFETGIVVEGARKYTTGARGDQNITIPFTLRGSYNF